jgi:hypothetical protein
MFFGPVAIIPESDDGFFILSARSISPRSRGLPENPLPLGMGSVNHVLRKKGEHAVHKVTIHIGEKTFEMEVADGASLLLEAATRGIPVPFQCTTGRCGWNL